MKPSRSLPGLRILTLCCLLFASGAAAQASGEAPAPDALFKELAALDGSLFDAFNGCDLEKFTRHLTEDVEFYHDKGGLLRGRQPVKKQLADGMCADASTQYRRELVPGSLEVYPLNNYFAAARTGTPHPYLYGAVQTGTQRIYVTQKGQKEMPVAVARFTHVWQYKNGKWMLSRMLSFDHQDVK
jgi:hypothetical protein